MSDTTSSGTDSDTSSIDSESDDGNEGRDLIAGCVELPKFLLTHSEYDAITVPQMKNFRMNTEKTKKSKAVKAKEFLATFDDRETSKKCCVIICTILGIVLLAIVIIIIIKITDHHS